MGNNARKRERRQEIAVVRQEGFDAAMTGKHEQTNPYRPHLSANFDQWRRGYAEGEVARQKIFEAEKEATVDPQTQRIAELEEERDRLLFQLNASKSALHRAAEMHNSMLAANLVLLQRAELAELALVTPPPQAQQEDTHDHD